MKPAEELSDVQLKRRRFIAAGILVALVALGFGFDHMAGLRQSRNASVCQLNLKQVSLAMMQYTRDYDEEYPLAKNWGEAIQPYHKAITLYNCPARSDLPFGYAMHASAAQLSLADVFDAQNTILLFDSDAGTPSRADTGTSLPPSPRHPRGHGIAFIDGHVRFMRAPDMKHGYLDPAESAKRRKERQRQRQESAQRVRKEEQQRLQQMKKYWSLVEQQWQRKESLRRQKELVKARKLSPLKKP